MPDEKIAVFGSCQYLTTNYGTCIDYCYKVEIATNGNRVMLLLMLTLEKHKDGIWIKRLVDELLLLQVNLIRIDVVSIESILHKVGLFDNHGKDTGNSSGTTLPTDSTSTASLPSYDIIKFLKQYDGIINRVSDAAEPIMVKRCTAIFTLIQTVLQNDIPIFNGPVSYGICCNKWLHHILFKEANLYSPSTMLLDVPHLKSELNDSRNNHETCESVDTLFKTSIAALCQNLLPHDPLPHLLKPNAGGFGDGIIKIDAGESTRDILPSSIRSNDDLILLQAFFETSTVYRVWFLLGKVQCAVQRYYPKQQYDSGSDASRFTTGCSSSTGVCSRNQAKRGSHGIASPSNDDTVIVTPWKVSEEVRIEMENQLLPILGQDAHAGSVEFFVHPTSDGTRAKYQEKDDVQPQPGEEGRRYYFDLNLLSTLPIDVVDGTSVWDTYYNPWTELANAIVTVIKSFHDHDGTTTTGQS